MHLMPLGLQMECISFLLIPDHCFFFSLQTLSFKSYFIRLYYCPLLFFVAIIRSYHMLHTHPITFYSLKILALDLLTRYNNTVVIILGNLNTCVDDTSISILTYCSLMIFILANSKLFSWGHVLDSVSIHYSIPSWFQFQPLLSLNTISTPVIFLSYQVWFYQYFSVCNSLSVPSSLNFCLELHGLSL